MKSLLLSALLLLWSGSALGAHFPTPTPDQAKNSLPTVAFSVSQSTLNLDSEQQQKTTPFEATCSIDHFRPEQASQTAAYSVVFLFNGHHFATFRSGKSIATFELNDPARIAGTFKVVKSTTKVSLPTFSVKVTPLATNASGLFSCNLVILATRDTPKAEFFSKPISVKVLPPIQQVTFSANVLSLPTNSSSTFTTTCHLDGLKESSLSSYDVRFLRRKDELLATYSVNEATKEAVLIVEDRPSEVSIRNGPRHAYPSFDLVITPKTATSDRYYCSVVDKKAGHTITSKKWPNEQPEVELKIEDFSTEKVSNRIAICKLDNVPANVTSYRVRFWEIAQRNGVTGLEEIASFKVDHKSQLTEFHHIADRADFSVVRVETAPSSNTYAIRVRAKSYIGMWGCELMLPTGQTFKSTVTVDRN